MLRAAGERFEIDGTEHAANAKCCWLGHHRGCPGWIHRQAVYGPAFVYECDGCDADVGRGDAE